MPESKRRVTSQDIPRMLATLSCGDPKEQTETLKLLCPCRNRRYDREVWLAIFQAYESGVTGDVRDQALHAIETLRERAKADPRTQELVVWLLEQKVTQLPLDEVLPEWKPAGRAGMNGLYIPRYEPSPRSKRNRRKR